MYIKCPKCGHQNDLGHLFCTKCSAKLDLSHVQDDIEDESQSQHVKAFFQVILLIVMVIMSVIGGLAGWPAKPFALKKGESGTSGGIETQLMALQLVSGRPGETITTYPSFEQKDVNTWLAKVQDKPKNLRAMSLLLQKDKVIFRATRVLGPYSLSVLETPKIPFSFEVTMKPAKGTLAVTSAKIGHLPMPGPAKKLVLMLIEPVIKGLDREKAIYKHITEINVEDGKITVTVTGS